MKLFFEIFAADLELSRAFYAGAIGLVVTHESPAFIVLEKDAAKTGRAAATAGSSVRSRRQR